MDEALAGVVESYCRFMCDGRSNQVAESSASFLGGHARTKPEPGRFAATEPRWPSIHLVFGGHDPCTYRFYLLFTRATGTWVEDGVVEGEGMRVREKEGRGEGKDKGVSRHGSKTKGVLSVARCKLH